MDATSDPSLAATPPPPAPGEPPAGIRRLPRVGDVLGVYELTAELGEGATATVFQARHTRIEREFAIKALHPDFWDQPEIIGRFFREAQAVNRINHRNIVEIYDLVRPDSGAPFIVMELLRGVLLADRISATDGLPEEEALHIAHQIAGAMAAIHSAQIVHRDLKPDNVFLIPEGGQFRVKLLDFGVAKFLEPGESQLRTQTGQALGTPEYMAPEQIIGANVDARVDIYAFGVILYEMLVGRTPFGGGTLNEVILSQLEKEPEPPSARMPEGGFDSPEIDSLVMGCLVKEPEGRIENMDIVQGTLRAMRGDVTAVLGIPAFVKRKGGKAPSQRRSWVLPAVAGGMALAAVGALALIWQTTRSPEALLPRTVLAGQTDWRKPWFVPPIDDYRAPVVKLSVVISSEPPRAAVYRRSDGRFLGRTPLPLPRPTSQKPVQLELRAKGRPAIRIEVSSRSSPKVFVTFAELRTSAMRPSMRAAPRSVPSRRVVPRRDSPRRAAPPPRRRRRQTGSHGTVNPFD